MACAKGPLSLNFVETPTYLFPPLFKCGEWQSIGEQLDIITREMEVERSLIVVSISKREHASQLKD